MTATDAVLTLRSVRVRFGGLAALDLDELVVGPASGVTTVFIGPNGAGKTTLLNAVTGYVPVETGGTIRLHAERDIELVGLNRDAIVRAGVARTFQTPLRFPSLTLREAMLVTARYSRQPPRRALWASLRGLTPPIVSETRLIEALLERMELRPVAHRRLNGLPLPVLRRAEFARCMATQPRAIMMLDEPTAGADDIERDRLVRFLCHDLQQLVADLHRAGLYRFATVTVGVITHDMTLARRLEESARPSFYALDCGRVLNSGSLDQVLADPRVVNLYLGRV